MSNSGKIKVLILKIINITCSNRPTHNISGTAEAVPERRLEELEGHIHIVVEGE